MKGSRYMMLIAFFVAPLLGAQNQQLLYDFVDMPQSLLLNPGRETSMQWYVGIPLLSGVSGYAGSNALSLSDFLSDDGVDINQKFRERVLNVLTPNDEISTHLRVDIFNGGFRGRDPKLFYSFGAYMELDNIFYWPQDYAFFFFDGNAGQTGRDYDLADLRARGSLVNVLHFGINKRVDKQLTLGFRAKYYGGVAHYDTTGNQGNLVNQIGENNLLSTTMNADLLLRTSGIDAWNAAADDDALVENVLKRSFFGGDMGLGFDVGFTYRLSDRTRITGSILDLGLMYHSGDVAAYSLNGSASIEGIAIDVLNEFADLDRDFWQELVDEVEETLPFETRRTSYLSLRPTKAHASIYHGFGEKVGDRADCDCGLLGDGVHKGPDRYRNGAGIQLFMVNRPKGPQAAITGFYQRYFGRLLALKMTYTADRFSQTNLGLGVNIQAGPINLYAMADNLLSYRNLADSSYLAFNLGLNILSW